MTIDEAIKHCLEVAENNEEKVKNVSPVLLHIAKSDMNTYKADCEQCAADHRQLAEWLTELKELRNSVGAVKLSNMKEASELIRAYKAENIAQKKLIVEYKRLLKVAVEDFNKMPNFICDCTGHCENCPIADDEGTCQNWQYEKEALELIGGD